MPLAGQPGYRFFFFCGRSPTAGCRVCRSFVRGKEPLLRTRELVVSRSVHGKAPKRQLFMVRHPRGSYVLVLPLPSLEVVTPEIKLAD